MLLEIKNIKKTFGKEQVLKNITFSAEGGTCVGILGGNGCGKSTLLSILAGVLKPGGGSMILDGHDLFGTVEWHRRNVGYVPQGTPLLEELTAKDNLRLWYSDKRMKEELDGGVLAMLGIGDFLKVPVKSMSGGMKKRLSIGCAISTLPPVLLMDEPCAALDLGCKGSILSYVETYKKRGGLVILTSHDEMELSACDKWFLIKDGLISEYEYDGNIDNLVKSL